MVRKSISFKLETSPMYHCDRTISTCQPLKNNQHLTLISVYTLTPMAGSAVKNSFYSDLRRDLNNTPANYEVLILVDFNARVWKESVAWEGVIGRHGLSNCDDNERLVVDVCTECQLTTTNTTFQQKENNLESSSIKTMASR